jgi:hypothetical protein
MKLYANAPFPTTIGQCWWKPSGEENVTEISVTADDIKKNKFRNFGGLWQKHPTYKEIEEYRAAYSDLYQRAKVIEKQKHDLEDCLIKFVGFMNGVSKRIFVPRKKIKEFLAPYQKTSTPENPPQ